MVVFWNVKKTLFSLLLLILFQSSVAYQVNPISVALEPVGRNASKDIKVINPGTVPIAIKVSMVTRQQNLNGTEIQRPADNKFIVYPQQMVIKSNSSQNVRIQWLGEQHFVREKNYRFIIEQVPVSLEYARRASRGIEVNQTLKGALYVRPKGGKSKIHISSATARGKFLDIILTNSGSVHSRLLNVQLTLKQGGRTIKLGKKDLPQISDRNVLAGSRRRFTIPLPTGFQAGQPVEALVKYAEVTTH